MPHIRLQLPSAPCTPPERQRNTVSEDKTLQSSDVLSIRVWWTQTHTHRVIYCIYVHISSCRHALGISVRHAWYLPHPTSQLHLPFSTKTLSTNISLFFVFPFAQDVNVLYSLIKTQLASLMAYLERKTRLLMILTHSAEAENTLSSSRYGCVYLSLLTFVMNPIQKGWK